MGNCPHYEFRQKQGWYYPPEHYCKYMKQTIDNRQLDCCFNYYNKCTEYQRSCWERRPNNNNNNNSRSGGGLVIIGTIVFVAWLLAKIWGLW